MSLKPRLDAAAASRNMAEIEPRYRPQEAIIESERCLYCFDAPCIMGCPTGIDVPGFIKKIATGNVTGAARTILQANVLGASCARVCPTSALCEGACVLQDRDHRPIKIGRLQRYATDHVMDNSIAVLHPAARKTGHRVALIGAGPAGLGCAAELAMLGHEAVIFEKKPHAGGLNTYGIAYYKMIPEVSLKEVELVRSLGVQIRTGTEVGRDIDGAQLLQEFDALFIGIGLGRTRHLGIPGEELPGVFEALDFIEMLHTRPLHEVPVGRRVAVIGCGNTAIDAVTQARRLGAEYAGIIYRRGEQDMPAYRYEYELAKGDGCGFHFHTQPAEILGVDRVTGLRLYSTRQQGPGGMPPAGNAERIEPYDMVIKALGQEPQSRLIQALFPGIELDSKGVVRRDFATGRTSIPRLFCGGDAANGGREVVNAVAEGKRAARGIHEMLCGRRPEGLLQATRIGVPGQRPSGSGFDHPIRVSELEAQYRNERETHG